MAEVIKHGVDALFEGELDEAKSENPALYERRMAGPQLIRVCHAAEDMIMIYGALRTYLKVLTQQPEEDLETIARVTRLMINIKPQAVEASREIARKEK